MPQYYYEVCLCDEALRIVRELERLGWEFV